jgi:aldose 1-epimerase
LHPSGEQFAIEADGHRAVVVEVGGGLRTYSVEGRDLLDGYDVDAMCTSGRGQVLIPWPNRLEDGSYEFDGRHHQLALTEAEQRNAIHGLVRWSAWSVAEHAVERVVMEHVLHPQPGYPFDLALRIDYSVSASGLTVRTTATNVGDEPCPYGSGAHPYLTLGTPTVDSIRLRAPARTVVVSSERGIPISEMAVEGSDFDFRDPRPIGRTILDNAFGELERDEDGIARVELSHGESGADVWLDVSYGYVMLFSGDPLPDVNRRSLAVEPMTCPPNAFRTGQSVVRLEPGQSFTSTWGISPRGVGA